MITPAGRFCLASVALVSLLPLAASEIPEPKPSPKQSTQEGLLLLHKMQDALGGAKAIAAIHDFDETIKAQAWDASGTALGEVRKRSRWVRNPNTLRLDQVGPRGTYVLYFDGGSGSGWEFLPDTTGPDAFKTTGKGVPLEGGELQFAKGYLSGFELNLWLADSLGYVVTSPRPNVLRIEHGDTATDFTLDPKTGLPLSSSGVTLADPDRPVSSEMRYVEWQEISGVRFPIHRVNYHSGLKRGEVTTGTIHVNVGLDPKQLAVQPADGAPELPRS